MSCMARVLSLDVLLKRMNGQCHGVRLYSSLRSPFLQATRDILAEHTGRTAKHHTKLEHAPTIERRLFASNSTSSNPNVPPNNIVDNSRGNRNVTRDPFARRPNKKCDPYGQSGKPMSMEEAKQLLKTTLETGWKLQEAPSEFGTNNSSENSSSDEVTRSDKENRNTDDGANALPPHSLYKEFYHGDNYMQGGARFVQLVTAVAISHNHYPTITLERRLVPHKAVWNVVTTVKCHTPTLGGLSQHDFHIAMMVDVEASRPEVQTLFSF